MYKQIFAFFGVCAVSLQLVQADFVNVTTNSGVNEFKESWGAVSCDWNKDGHIDILLNNHRDPLSLYRNNGDGTFTNATHLVKNPVSGSDEHGIVCADFYPNDNYLEFAITTGGADNIATMYRKFFKFNSQSGKFEDIAASVNFQIKKNPGRSLLAADYNGDNRLDIFESARKKSSVVGSAAYQFNRSNNRFDKLSGKLNDKCQNSVVLFSKYTDLDQDTTPEIACIGQTLSHGLFEFNNGFFKEIWGQVSPTSYGEKRYNTVRDIAIADFNGDNKTDIFVLRRASYPANAYLKNGQVRSRIVTQNNAKGFHFYAGDKVVTLKFAAPRLTHTTGIFYGQGKLNDPSFSPPWVKLQTVTLNPNDSRFWGKPNIGTKDGVYIWYDKATKRWHTKVSSKIRLQLDTHHYASGNLSGLVTDFDTNQAARKPHLLMHKTGASGYNDVVAQSSFNKLLNGLAVETGDFDNDGDNDLYLVLSNSPEDLADEYYVNDGTGKFTLKQRLRALSAGNGESLSVADYNQDGCLDMVVVNGHGEAPNNRGPVQIMQGQCPSTNHWVQFDLDSAVPNGLGATVEVTAGNKTYSKLQDGGARLFGQNAQRLHFGLGRNVTAVDVVVRWANGAVTQYSNVTTDAVYTLTPSGSVTPIGTSASPRLTINNDSVIEGGTASLTVRLSPTSSSTVTVDYQTVNGSAMAGSDYTGKSNTLTFAPNQSTKSITVKTLQNTVTESDENFTVRLSNATNANMGQSTGTVTIQDDDNGSAGITCGDPGLDPITESEMFIWQDCSSNNSWHLRTTAGNTSVVTYTGNLTSNRSFSNVENVSVELSDTVDTTNPQVIVFDLKVGSAGYDGFNFNVPSGNTCLSLDSPAGISVKVGKYRTPMSSAFNIETLGSCGSTGQPSLSVSDAQTSESIGTAQVTVSLLNSSTSVVTVDYQTVGDTAKVSSDYSWTSGTLTFNAGDTSKTITIPIINDANTEASESFKLRLSNATNATIADNTAVVTIQSDGSGVTGDACGDPGIDQMADRELFIWRDCGGDGRWYVRATAGDGSFLTYTGNLTTNQSFSNIEEVSIEYSDTLDITNPQIIEFNLKLSSVWFDGFNFKVPSGNTCLTLDSPARLAVKVGKNRIPVSSAFNIETLASCTSTGQPGLSVADTQVSENAGTARMTVTLQPSSASAVTVDYQTVNNTAIATSDFTRRSGTITFNPGVTSQTVSIPIINDANTEPSESFRLRLSNATNATIADNTAVVTIEDDDSGGVTGDACGDPGFDRTTERDLFIWQDCSGDGRWYVRATAGGASVLTYTGNLISNRSFSNIEMVSVESTDTVNTNNSKAIHFNLKTSSVWFDGFDFNVPSGNTCLTLKAPTGVTVKVGKNRTPVSSAFDIETLSSCQ